MWYYQNKRDDSEVINRLTELTELYSTLDLDENFYKLCDKSLKWNRERVLCVYRNIKLSLRSKHKKPLVNV